MGVLKCGKYACQGTKLSMHTCMYENKGHKGHVPCEWGLRPTPPPKKQVNMGPLPPQECKNAAHLPLSLTFQVGSLYSLSYSFHMWPSIAKRGQSHLPLSLMHDSAFPYLFLQGNQEKRRISTLVFSDWSTSHTWGGKHHVSLTPFLQEDPLPLDSSFWTVEECPISLVYAF